MQEERQATVVTSENLVQFQLDKMGIKPEEVKEESKQEEKKEEIKEEIEKSQEEDSHEEEANSKHEKNPLKERFSKLTQQRNQAREEAAKARAEREELQAKLKEYETKLNPETKSNEDAKPDPKNFTDAFEYAEKLAEWSAKEAIKNKEKEEKERGEKEAQDKVLEGWRSRLEKAKSEIEDWEEVVSSSEVKVSDQVRDAILRSEVGPQILYQLANNDTLAEKIAQMTVIDAIREIGKLEARLEKSTEEKKEEKPKVEVSKAPEPIKPISSGKSDAEPIDSKGDVKVDFSQYKALRKAGKIK